MQIHKKGQTEYWRKGVELISSWINFKPILLLKGYKSEIEILQPKKVKGTRKLSCLSKN